MNQRAMVMARSGWWKITMKTPQVWRVKGEKVVIHYTLMMTKFRVQTIKYVTIPRLKLMAAVLAMTVSQAVRREMDIYLIQVTNYCSGQIARWHLDTFKMKPKYSKHLLQV